MKRNILFLILCSFVKLEAQTAQIIGGTIRYEALGNNHYKIIGILNRRCDGPAMAIPTLAVFTANNSYNLTLSRTKIEDVTPICKTGTKPCSPQNTQTIKGIEQHTFESTIDFNSSPYTVFKNNGNCQVFFGLTGNKRSDSITNLSTKGDIYLEAMLDLCVLGSDINNSPIVKGEMASNICLNQPLVYNAKINDKVDFDSISTLLFNPQSSKTVNENYSGSFSKNTPLTPYCPPNPGVLNCKALPNAKPPRGIYFESITSDFIFTPIAKEIAAVGTRTYEFRKINGISTLIGYITSENIFEINVCNDNNPPQIIGNNKYSVCEGDKLCFTIDSKDDPFLPNQTILDTVRLFWDSAIVKATFTMIDKNAREKQAQFCWQTNIGDANKSYTFTTTAMDDFCPNNGVSSKGFLITVKPKANALINLNELYNNELEFYANPNGTNAFTYDWKIRDSSNTGNIMHQSNAQIDSFKFAQKGTYIITLTINNPLYNCPKIIMDTITIVGKINTSVDFKIKLKPIKVFPNPTTKILNIELRKGEKFTTMKLYNLQGKVVLEKTLEPTIDMSQYENGIYTLEIIGENGRYYTKVIKV